MVLEKWEKQHDEVDAAFGDGSILTASEEDLVRHLQTLCTGSITNGNIQYREIIRGITINHIQMARTIDRLNRQNTILTWVVILLAMASMVATFTH